MKKNSSGSNNLSLKYQRLIPSGFKDIEIRKFEFLAKTQFLLILRKRSKDANLCCLILEIQNSSVLFNSFNTKGASYYSKLLDFNSLNPIPAGGGSI